MPAAGPCPAGARREPAPVPRKASDVNQRQGTLLAVILGSAIVFLDSTVVNVALPKIGQELPRGIFGVLEGQAYVYNGYLLTLSALLIVAGALADAHGRRRLFLVGLAGFGVTSVLCGLAPSLEALIVFRILQGATGAILVPGSLAILTASFDGEELGRAFGFWAGASGATTILGPFVGGVLVQSFTWRAAFLLNVPLVLLALWATLRHVEESRDPEASGAIDWAGAATAALAVGGLSFGAIYGQQREWRDLVGPGAIAVGLLAAAAFMALMARGRHPLVPLGMFRSRNFAVTNISTFLIYGALYVILYEQAIFAQGTLGYTAAAAGLIGVVASVMLTLLSTRAGVLGSRYGPRRFMVVGPALMAAGVLWYARTPATSPPWQLLPGDPASWIPPVGFVVDFLPGGIVFGAGLAIMVAPLTTALMTSVPPRNAALASAINNAVSRVGPQLVNALIFVGITAVFYSGIAARVQGVDTTSAALRDAIAPLNAPAASVAPALALAARDASTDAYHLAMLVAAGLLALGALVNALGIRDTARARGRALVPEEELP
jgi:EmrB/QacA subfamily drug resistance transporter